MVYNAYIVIPLATWAVAQVLKFAIAALRGRLDFRYLYASGGMPSVHAAVVCSLAVTASLLDGASSHLFGLAAVLAAIVIYDSLGVRRAAGEQATAINAIAASLASSKIRLDPPNLRVKEVLGHKLGEVLAGAGLGIVLAGLFNYDKLGALSRFVEVVPKGIELWSYLGVAAVLVVAGIAQRIILQVRYRKSLAIRRLSKQILIATQITGWLGVVASAFIYERASYLSWRLWILLVGLAALVWLVTLWLQNFRALPRALAAEANQARKARWFQWGKNRKRK